MSRQIQTCRKNPRHSGRQRDDRQKETHINIQTDRHRGKNQQNKDRQIGTHKHTQVDNHTESKKSTQKDA